MDSLLAEIAKKKKKIEQSNVLRSGSDAGATYFKRSDMSAYEDEEYWKENKRFKPSDEDETTSQEESVAKITEKEPMELPSFAELKIRLRDLHQPIRLFGEMDAEIFQRFKRLEVMRPEINKGRKNDFKDAMDKVDQEYLNQIASADGMDGNDVDKQKKAEVKIIEDDITWEELQKLALTASTARNAKAESKLILKFMRLILKIWGENLNTRPTEEKLSMNGRLVSATYTQTVSYIKPLLKKLKQNNLQNDQLNCMSDMVSSMLEREYLKANEAYLEMAIGNAPWPIGVTMVGIHARPGREKVNDRYIAHVLNDETQRKYIQAFKRLMVQCQTFYPTDPHKSVDYQLPRKKKPTMHVTNSQ